MCMYKEESNFFFFFKGEYCKKICRRVEVWVLFHSSFKEKKSVPNFGTKTNKTQKVTRDHPHNGNGQNHSRSIIHCNRWPWTNKKKKKKKSLKKEQRKIRGTYLSNSASSFNSGIVAENLRFNTGWSEFFLKWCVKVRYVTKHGRHVLLYYALEKFVARVP